MRVVLAIFLVGGLVIALALAVGGAHHPQTTPARMDAARSTAAPTPTPEPPCEPGSGPEEVGAVPADVQERVDRAWERIEKWLDATVPSQVVWNPPAADAAIARAQRAAGHAFPPDLVASLRRHDGVRAAAFTFPPYFVPMSTGEIAADAGKLCAADNGWDGRGIPFARDNGGWYLYIDPVSGVHEHAPGGTAGTRDASLAALLERTADVLEGRRTDVYLPVVGADGELGWRLR
ncbi:SMI1/KNR4 family protein [Actinokineospora soli]|uniref:SMI1/KNR4 family protein n=1 Tax=Actinokineospora soli TaxID=1048753 RepID=A0ABW2TI68_9PSEU